MNYAQLILFYFFIVIIYFILFIVIVILFFVERRETINTSVSTEIVAIFKGKTPKQLQAMYRQIEQKISGNQDGIDIGMLKLK